jgi:hypothetical protein
MIAFRNDLPLVSHPGGQAHTFDAERLLVSLECAARKAGYPKWWLCEHVTQSVLLHFRTEFLGSTVSSAELESAVRAALQCIGYSEVGQLFSFTPPSQEVSVLQLARQAGSGYELAFFDLLARQIRALVLNASTHFVLCGLEPAVKLLRSKKAWCRDCETLRCEIVVFTRDHVQGAAGGREIGFSLI